MLRPMVSQCTHGCHSPTIPLIPFAHCCIFADKKDISLGIGYPYGTLEASDTNISAAMTEIDESRSQDCSQRNSHAEY